MQDRARTLPKAAAAILAAATAIAVASCAPTDSTYFPSVEPTTVTIPTVDHETVYIGVSLLNAGAGDIVLIESVTAENLAGGANVEGLISVLDGKTVWIGASTESALDDAGIDLDDYRGAAGSRFSASDGPVALAVRVHPARDESGFGSIVLGFRVNDGELQSKRFPIAAKICSAASLQQGAERCRPASSQRP